MRKHTTLTCLWLAAMAALIPPAARADEPGDFDYYVMALSWSPSWCAREGDDRDADQCDVRHDYGWTLHGLWPQYETGYPENCNVPRSADPSRAQSDRMTDIMGSGGLAWYQWKKHGRCTGLTGTEYYALSRAAYGAVNRPEVLRKLPRPIEVPVSVIEEAWIQANPSLKPDQITLTCDRAGRIAEARICLSKDLELRRCGTDVIRDCTNSKARMDPIR